MNSYQVRQQRSLYFQSIIFANNKFAFKFVKFIQSNIQPGFGVLLSVNLMLTVLFIVRTGIGAI